MADSISQLQQDIANPSVSVVSLLHKAIPIASRLGDTDFLKWATQELKGYSEGESACDYRRLKGQYVVLGADGRPIPIVWHGNEAMNSRFITLPLAETESLLAGDGDIFAVKIRVDPKSLASLDLEPGDTIGFSIARATILGFLNAIRQRLLEWTLTLPTSSDIASAVSATPEAPAIGEVAPETATVFYSWQSDLPNSTNRGFIEECLERAIKELKAEGQLRVEPCLDRDTMNVPGSPDIAATIFEKIESAALFVCDVSIINKEAENRLTPNPNVLIELGYAVKTLGWNRVICVFNGFTGNVEDLPFDLRHRRIQAYTLEEKQEKSEPRKQLVRSLKADLQAAFSFTEPQSATTETGKPDVASSLPRIGVLDTTVECQPPIIPPAEANVHHIRPQYAEGRLVWTVTASLFVDSRPGEVFSVALHRCKAWMNDRYSGERIPIADLAFRSEARSQVTVDDAVLLIRGPGRVSLQGSCETPFRQSGYPDTVTIDVELPVTEAGNEPIRVSLAAVEAYQGSGGWPLRWKYREVTGS